MKLIFIGSGSAMTVGSKNYHSNILLISPNNEKFLIDCGSDARHALSKIGFSYLDIDNVYISHLHADHAGGLEWLALSTKFDPRAKKPNLFIAEPLIQELWQKTLSGGLGTLEFEIASLDTYFNVIGISVNSSFIWEACQFKILQTIHVFNGFSLMPSYGLLININEKLVLITTDIQFYPGQMMHLYEEADIIFHDCETAINKSGVHAHYEQLASLPLEIKSKMWLYHYNPGALPDSQKDGFLGFVQRGQSFEI